MYFCLLDVSLTGLLEMHFDLFPLWSALQPHPPRVVQCRFLLSSQQKGSFT